MSLIQKLKARAANNNPVRVGIIGAGKFGSMYLSQAPRTPGIHLVAVADLSPARAKESLARVGWDTARYSATSLQDAAKSGATFVTDDAEKMIASEHIDIVIDSTGSPSAGIRHALLCIDQRKHIIMVNVEADVLAGPLLARKAAEAGVIYSMASGDQPALIAELVDWARTIGLEVVCAGKGTKYLPIYHQSTPDTVWGHYGFSQEQVAGGDFNAQMFNSFLDGTKFDSSLDRNDPIEFKLGQGMVIKGWDEGIALLKVGGKALLIIPSNLAYGSRGAGGVIPPFSPLTFEVELVSVQ